MDGVSGRRKVQAFFGALHDGRDRDGGEGDGQGVGGQDGQAATPLNCTVNAGVDDNGEHNHCEWGLVSRDGWVVYDDTANVCLDGNDWWSNSGNRTCLASQAGTDAVNPANSAAFPLGTTVADEGA